MPQCPPTQHNNKGKNKNEKKEKKISMEFPQETQNYHKI
jgi:hypothetical protein